MLVMLFPYIQIFYWIELFDKHFFHSMELSDKQFSSTWASTIIALPGSRPGAYFATIATQLGMLRKMIIIYSGLSSFWSEQFNG